MVRSGNIGTESLGVVRECVVMGGVVVEVMGGAVVVVVVSRFTVVVVSRFRVVETRFRTESNVVLSMVLLVVVY